MMLHPIARTEDGEKYPAGPDDDEPEPDPPEPPPKEKRRATHLSHLIENHDNS